MNNLLPYRTILHDNSSETYIDMPRWRHIWRVVGHYANISIFDVESPTELHAILNGLPLFPYMTIEVNALCPHPSSVHGGDR